nr:MAG TPA: hypothetical protein [Caudoviricetes sp.]
MPKWWPPEMDEDIVYCGMSLLRPSQISLWKY